MTLCHIWKPKPEASEFVVVKPGESLAFCREDGGLKEAMCRSPSLL